VLEVLAPPPARAFAARRVASRWKAECKFCEVPIRGRRPHSALLRSVIDHHRGSLTPDGWHNHDGRWRSRVSAPPSAPAGRGLDSGRNGVGRQPALRIRRVAAHPSHQIHTKPTTLRYFRTYNLRIYISILHQIYCDSHQIILVLLIPPYRRAGGAERARGAPRGDQPADGRAAIRSAWRRDCEHTRARLAVGGAAICAPPCTVFLVILFRKYTGMPENDFTAHG
jgi:hypothetical protein